MKLKLPHVKRLRTGDRGVLSIEVPKMYQEQYAAILHMAPDYLDVEICPPKRARTTGKGSQNNHAWGHIAQIANHTGHDVSEIEAVAKMQAIKRGYPYTEYMGLIIPKSQTDITTTECGFLIDELHAIAAELDIQLVEE